MGRKLSPEEERISQYLYGFVLGILSSFTVDMFEQMADNNISPFDLGIELDQNSINNITGIIKKYRSRVDEYLNYDWMMSRMKIRRPDLYGFFSSEKGKNALIKWIGDIKKLIDSI